MNPHLTSQPDNPMVRLDAVIAGLKTTDRPIFDLGVGDPREPTPHFIVEALRKAVPEVSQYPRVIGTPALRQAIAGYLERRFGVKLDPEREILPASGAKEAIFHLPLALIDSTPGATKSRRVVLYPDPGYPIYERGAAFAGGEPIAVRVTDGWGPALDDLPEALLARTAIFWLCTPHNPTGEVVERAPMERLARLSERFGFAIASDECYADLWSDRAPPSILEVARTRVLAFHSLSKRSGMTGMRSGFMAGDATLIAALKRFRPSIGTASPDFIQAAATAAWSADAHVATRRESLNAKRALFLSLFTERGLPASGNAGLYLWVDVRRRGNGDDETYALKLAHGAGVVVQPGSFSGPGGKGFLRVALSPLLADCARAVQAWRAFDKEHP